jgi:glycosyltransferase involved in cell wall biosynthesis
MVIDPWRHPYNGMVVSTRRFVTALAASGHAFNVLAVSGDAEGPPGDHALTGFEQMSFPGFNHIIDSMRSPLARPDRERIRAVLEESDVLHVQFPFFLGHTAMDEADKLGVPIVCSFHIQPENILNNLGLRNRWLRDRIYRFFVSSFFDRAAAVVAPSEFAAELLREAGLKRPIAVISNGVPEAFFELPRRANGSGGGRLRVLSVGRLAPEKHPETLLQAVARSAHRDRIDLTLAGVGPQEEKLKALAANLGLDARIGPVSDEALMALYDRADLFIHCGAVELEGMSVLEAMAAANAVIVADSPDSASPHLAHDEGARFRPGDAADLAGKMDDWLADPDHLAAQGEANRRYAAAFAHRRSVAQLEELYASVTPDRA